VLTVALGPLLWASVRRREGQRAVSWPESVMSG
jgi:hypothetical protein